MLDYDNSVFTMDDNDVIYDVYDVTTPAAAPTNQSNVSRPMTSLHMRDEGLARVEVAVQALIFVLALVGNTCVLVALK